MRTDRHALRPCARGWRIWGGQKAAIFASTFAGPPATPTAETAVSSRSRRWRTGDESVCVASRWDTAPVILPWNRVFLYDLRLQSFTEPYNAISSDGVSLTATVIVRFRLQRDSVPVLHQAIGPNYEQVLVQPGIGSLTRQVIAQYTAEQVYSTARQEIQDKIRSLVEERLSEKMMEHAGEEGEESYRVSMSDTLILYDILVTG